MIQEFQKALMMILLERLTREGIIYSKENLVLLKQGINLIARSFETPCKILRSHTPIQQYQESLLDF